MHGKVLLSGKSDTRYKERDTRSAKSDKFGSLGMTFPSSKATMPATGRARSWRQVGRDPALRERVLVVGGGGPACPGSGPTGRLSRDQLRCPGQCTKDYAWFRLLPRGKTKRGRHRGRGGRSHIPRQPLAQRPKEAEDRSGHWEADLMLFGNRGQSLLVLQAPLSLGQPMFQKAADPMAQAMTQPAIPHQWRRTVTFDNGSEFSQHHRLHNLGFETFFCDTHSPWREGRGGKRQQAGCVAICPRRLTCAGPSLIELSKPVPPGSLRPPAHQPLHLKCEFPFPLRRE